MAATVVFFMSCPFSLKGDIAVLLGWISVGLVLENLQRSDHLGSSASGVNNVVEVTLASGYIGVGEFVPVISDQFLPCLFWVFRLIDSIFEEDEYSQHNQEISRAESRWDGKRLRYDERVRKKSQPGLPRGSDHVLRAPYDVSGL